MTFRSKLIFTSKKSEERFSYNFVGKYLKTIIEPYQIDMLYGLDDKVILAEYGMKVFTGFDVMPSDLLYKVNQSTIEELQDIFDMPFMQTKKFKNHILSGYPFSFVMLVKLLVGLYPNHEMLKNKALRPLLYVLSGAK